MIEMKFQEKSAIEQEQATMESSSANQKMEFDQKTDKLKIVLDHSDNTYHSGAIINGTIIFPENYTEIRGKCFVDFLPANQFFKWRHISVW